MAQTILRFQYEVEKKPRGMTALARLPNPLDGLTEIDRIDKFAIMSVEGGL